MLDSKLIRSAFLGSMLIMIMNNMVCFAGSLVDGMIISRFLGPHCMAAFQLCIPFNLCTGILIQVFFVGTQTFCGKQLGMGRTEEACSAYTTSLAILVLCSSVLALLIGCFAHPLSTVLGVSGKTAFLSGDVSAYLQGVSFGMPAMCMLPLVFSMLYLEGRSGIVSIAMLMQAVVDIVLDLVIVLVMHGGMFGMGIATSVSYICSVLFLLIVQNASPSMIRLRPGTIRLAGMKEIFVSGLPAAGDRAYKMVQMIVLNKVLAFVATSEAIAAFGIINTLNNIYLPVMLGITMTAVPLLSVFYGERDRRSIRILLDFACRVSLIIESVIVVVSFIAAPLLMKFFIKDGDTAVAVSSLRIFVLYLPFYTLSNVFQRYYNCIGKLKITYIMSALENLILICGFAVLLGSQMGSGGVFLAHPVTELVTLGVLFLYTYARLHRMPRSINDFLDLPPDFELSEEESFTASAQTGDDVTKISRDLYTFCLEHEMNKRQAILFSLAVEEMGMNAVQKGFKNNKKGSMDIRLFRNDPSGSWTLRIRDNGDVFDPVMWLHLHKDPDPFRNIGIRMTLSNANDVSYVNTLRINNLLIHY